MDHQFPDFKIITDKLFTYFTQFIMVVVAQNTLKLNFKVAKKVALYPNLKLSKKLQLAGKNYMKLQKKMVCLPFHLLQTL